MITFTELNHEVIATFDNESIRLAAERADQRRSSARSKNRKQAYFIEGTKWDSLDTEIHAMMAEYAVAHFFGQTEWEPIMHRPDRADGDVVIGRIPIEVKSTDRSNGCLPVKEDETRQRPYVLTIVKDNQVRIVGWQMSQNCKKKEWWRSDVRYPAYFVPQNALRPIASLKRAVSSV